MRRVLTTEQEVLAAQLYASGESGPELARKYRVDPSVIYGAVRRQGGRVRPLTESNANSIRACANLIRKVSPELLAGILAEYQACQSTYQVAKKFGISQGHVSKLVQRAGVPRRKPGKPRTYTLNKSAFDNAEANQDAAYFVGLIMADGSVRKREYGWQLSIALSNEDGRHLQRRAAFLGTDHPLYEAAARVGAWNRGESTRLAIDSARIAKALLRYGVKPRKSRRQSVAVLETNRHFWRGMVDGDGYLGLFSHEDGIRPVLGRVGSKKICRQFAAFVGSHTPTRASVLPMHSIWRFEVTGSHARAIARLLYTDCQVALPRKLAKAQEILAF